MYRDDISCLADAIAILDDVYQKARRMLGPDHPLTGKIQHHLSEARESQAADAADVN